MNASPGNFLHLVARKPPKQNGPGDGCALGGVSGRNLQGTLETSNWLLET